MKNLMDKHAIIKLKLAGYSNRKVAKMLHINRKTVAKYWDEYKEQSDLINIDTADIKEIQEVICSEPTYNSSGRKPRKYTKEMDQFLDGILEKEKEKCKLLGTNKQQLTQIQIYEMMKEKGFDISKSTIGNKIREKRNKPKECYVKQQYDYGDRLEYDFGEVKLEINGVVNTYYLAVLSSPASNFKWAYLYKNQKKEVFLDSHVRFFEMVKGVYKEVVYDNMKNVVTRFIGRHERELNEDLVKMALYYGFEINVTNCFKGNEKGHVESSVKVLRNKIFAGHYRFKTLDEASNYLHNQLVTLSGESEIQAELGCLLPYKPQLELANIKMARVNKYSFVRVEHNFYSVPEYLVDKKVTVKSYYDHIVIFANNHRVCEHKKIDGANEISIDIKHYLNTFAKKPGAIKNSHALKSLPQLKSIYDSYFSKHPKEFIELIRANKEKDMEEIVGILRECGRSPLKVLPGIAVKDEFELGQRTRLQTKKYNNICVGGVNQYGYH